MQYVSVWYEKLHFLGLKMTVFCHFETFDHQKNLLRPVMLAKEASADTQRPIKPNFKIFVHYFSMGVRITVQELNNSAENQFGYFFQNSE